MGLIILDELVFEEENEVLWWLVICMLLYFMCKFVVNIVLVRNMEINIGNFSVLDYVN